MDALPLPEHPALRQVAEQLEGGRVIAEVLDARWRLAYLTRDYLLASGATPADALPIVGEPVVSARSLATRSGWPGFATTESWCAGMTRMLPAMVHDLPGGIDEVAADIADELRPGLSGLEPHPADSLIFEGGEIKFGRRTTPYWSIGTRILDAAGALAGTVFVVIPAVSGATLSLLATADHRSLERLLDVARPARRAGAILFADLEGSSALARRLPAAQYFRLVRRLMSTIDAEIVERGGLVGKHAGDGVSALFLSEQLGSESAAVRACVEAALSIARATDEIAERSDLAPDDVVVRFGLHWGATLYVGSLLTSGRSDATALGDEMNEAARIEACASGGRLLASKALVERLDDGDAAALSLGAPRYVPLGDLDTATEKARRDAPAVAVCDLDAR